ncbi:MAG: hypothetical protein GY710_11440, partial [Desulfobacteraceae bacterium]|nr:hypothetical protein [Desulfobacteraceae bacterium]
VYTGSIDKYHLFNLAHKGPIAADEILNFAVLKENCIIDNPSSPEEIRKKDEPLKWVEIKNGKVVIISNNS